MAKLTTSSSASGISNGYNRRPEVQEALRWLSDLLRLSENEQVIDLTQLANGAYYCQCLDALCPDIPLSKVNFDAEFYYDYVQNLKFFQLKLAKRRLFTGKNIDFEAVAKGQHGANYDVLNFLRHLPSQDEMHTRSYDAIRRREIARQKYWEAHPMQAVRSSGKKQLPQQQQQQQQSHHHLQHQQSPSPPRTWSPSTSHTLRPDSGQSLLSLSKESPLGNRGSSPQRNHSVAQDYPTQDYWGVTTTTTSTSSLSSTLASKTKPSGRMTSDHQSPPRRNESMDTRSQLEFYKNKCEELKNALEEERKASSDYMSLIAMWKCKYETERQQREYYQKELREWNEVFTSIRMPQTSS